jgi:hypothetical protein
MFELCKAGYGTLEEIKKLPLREALDLIEFHNIYRDIENRDRE